MVAEAGRGVTARQGAARRGVVCTHCGLPVPAGLVREGPDEQFCCAACETVYAVINRCGLEQYYALRERFADRTRPARTTGRTFADFDDESFTARHVRPRADGGAGTDLVLEGVHCAACVWLVEKLPQLVAGVRSARLDLGRARVNVEWEPELVSLSRIAGVLDSLGYPPHPATDSAQREARVRSDRVWFVRMGVAGAIAGNQMLLAFALYSGALGGIEPIYEQLFRWASMVLGVLAVAWPGRVFFRGALAALRTRTNHLDLPIAVGLLVGTVAGVVNTIRGTGHIYFDSLSALVFLLLVGRWIQQRRHRAAADALELLHTLTPRTARLVEGERFREVPAGSLRPGQVIEVRAEETIGADGKVIEGRSAVDVAVLTGESVPVPIGIGGAVHAGATNLSDTLRVVVEAVGEEARLGKLLRLVEEASTRRAPVVELADRIAGWFVLGLLGLAALTGALWWSVSPERAVAQAMAVLIVCCPCALGLATPLTFGVAIGRAARRGMLIKGGHVIQLLARPGTILLDKTGTVTVGDTSVVRWAGEDAVRPLVAALERRSSHPVAWAIVRAWDDGEQHDVEGVVQSTGRGMSGGVDGHWLVVGSSGFVASAAAMIPGWADEEARSLIDDGLSPVFIGVDGVVELVAGLGDPVRSDSRAAIDRIRASRWRAELLSGDHAEIVGRVGERLGFDAQACRGGATPEQKLATVEARFENGPVVMVGDGVNDAAALARATVGIAVHGGAEAATTSADVALTQPGLAPVAELLDASRAVMRTVRWTIGVSIAYNAVGGGLAVAGLISPLVAAVLMPASSLTVLAMALHQRAFRGGS